MNRNASGTEPYTHIVSEPDYLAVVCDRSVIEDVVDTFARGECAIGDCVVTVFWVNDDVRPEGFVADPAFGWMPEELFGIPTYVREGERLRVSLPDDPSLVGEELASPLLDLSHRVARFSEYLEKVVSQGLLHSKIVAAIRVPRQRGL